MKRRRKVRVRRGLRRGAYLLPSLFTIASILLGFYAVILGFREEFQTAALLIFTALVLDGLDGRIARLTQTESEFGREYDSLADVLTFGASPALLAYVWGLWQFGRLGWLAPLFYLVCTATRLARFNVQARVVDSRYFVGLPAPAAAAAPAAMLFFAPDSDWQAWLAGALMIGLVGLGVLMLSTFRYPSFKEIDLRRRWSYRVLPPLAAVVLVIAYHPPAVFLVLAVLYALSGPTSWVLMRLRRRRPEPTASAPSESGRSEA